MKRNTKKLILQRQLLFLTCSRPRYKVRTFYFSHAAGLRTAIAQPCQMVRPVALSSGGDTCQTGDRTRITPPPRCHTVRHASSLGTPTHENTGCFISYQQACSQQFPLKAFIIEATKTPRCQRATTLSESFQHLRGTLHGHIIPQTHKLPRLSGKK